jgi:hypothetical protein
VEVSLVPFTILDLLEFKVTKNEILSTTPFPSSPFFLPLPFCSYVLCPPSPDVGQGKHLCFGWLNVLQCSPSSLPPVQLTPRLLLLPPSLVFGKVINSDKIPGFLRSYGCSQFLELEGILEVGKDISRKNVVNIYQVFIFVHNREAGEGGTDWVREGREGEEGEGRERGRDKSLPPQRWVDGWVSQKEIMEVVNPNYYIPEEGANMYDLPADCVFQIFLNFRNLKDFIRAHWVCKGWQEVCKEPKLWEPVYVFFFLMRIREGGKEGEGALREVGAKWVGWVRPGWE